MLHEKYEIIETDTFEFELNDIIKYIYYNLNQPNIAKRKYKKINQYISTLDIFPERCPKVFDENSKIRRFIFDNYIVIYEVVKDTRTNIYYTHISF